MGFGYYVVEPFYLEDGMSSLPGVFKTLTPHDTNEQPGLPGQVYVGVSGDVAIKGEGGGDVVVLKSHPIGYIPGRVARVYATNTTATNLVAMNS